MAKSEVEKESTIQKADGTRKWLSSLNRVHRVGDEVYMGLVILVL